MARAFVGLTLVALLGLGVSSAPQARAVCRATQPDSLGPFYEPGAPVRSRVGSGYVLSGTVRRARSCAAIPGARIEVWLANADGDYDDAHRATLFATRRGAYRFESNR